MTGSRTIEVVRSAPKADAARFGNQRKERYLKCNDRELTRDLWAGHPTMSDRDYWLKANGIVACWRDSEAVHRWVMRRAGFPDDVEATVALGVSELAKLRDDCAIVLASSKLIESGLRPDGTRAQRLLEDASVARAFLPTGWRFDEKAYDEAYLRQVEYTYDTLSAIIERLSGSSDGHAGPLTYKDPDWVVCFTYTSD